MQQQLLIFNIATELQTFVFNVSFDIFLSAGEFKD